MTYSSALLLTLAFTLAVSANPVVIRDTPITLAITKRLNANGTFNLLERDQARVKGLKQFARQKTAGTLVDAVVASVPVTNQAVDYVANVGVGTPPTTFSLLVDTGSSNTWVGAGKAFRSTSSTSQTSDRVAVTYGSGSFSGNEFIDTVTLGSGLTITKQSIGVATRSTGFDGVDGILGIGPVDLTVGTLTNARATIPTVTDNLFSQGIITSNLVAVSFAPTSSESITNGELTFGGTDSSKFTGSIHFAPITSTSPASEFWGIDQTIRYGASTSIQSLTAGIVDTGTTLVLIASDSFRRYTTATGGVNDRTTGLLRLTQAQFANLQSLFFTVNGVTFELTANAQIWPRALNTAIGGNANSVYLIVNDIGTPSGEGLDFINGMTFLERFYSVFDTANRQIGLATTSATNATPN